MTPIAPGLWTDEAQPRLIGARGSDGRVRFPMPEGDAAAGFEAVPMSRTGTLWSWTLQSFEPKRPPYDGPQPFEPYLLAYVELDHAIVEARLAGVETPEIGMALELAIVPFDATRSIFAFGPPQ